MREVVVLLLSGVQNVRLFLQIIALQDPNLPREFYVQRRHFVKRVVVSMNLWELMIRMF